jgi:ParB/RepB/Spo0J family partition protein
MDREGRKEEMSSAKFITISTALLEYSGKNPRQEMRGLGILAENIKEYGVLEPIIVRPKGDKFEVVVGERRVRATMIAGLKEVPAIIRALTDRQTDELRLIENIHREDLTTPEKGDAVLALVEDYPEKYPTFKSVADSLDVPYGTIKDWCLTSRKISPFIKDGLGLNTLTEDVARYVMKYEHSVQDRLAKCVIKHQLAGESVRKFFRMYNENPLAELDVLAEEAKGAKTVRISLEKLPEGIRKEVEKVAIPEYVRKPKTEEVKKKIRETLRETRERVKKAKEKQDRVPLQQSTTTNTVEKLRLEVERVPSQVPDNIERLTQEVTEQIRQTVIQAPEKIQRISEIVNEELSGLRKRLEIFPEKSKKIEPKFEKFDSLIDRGVIPYTVWDFQYRDDYAGDKDFHGNCSPQIVEQCIWRLTEEGNLVVDPMAGSGTTLDVCRRFNRKCISYDISPLQNRSDIVRNDSRKIPLESSSVDMIFIHPPYWNLTYFTKAEENLPDLSRAKDVDEFIDMLEQVFRECYRILKPEKFMCVLLGDLIREGKFVPLCRKTINMAERIGFSDYGQAVKIAHGEVSRKKSGVIIAEPIYTDNLKISHDLIMFLRKT